MRFRLLLVPLTGLWLALSLSACVDEAPNELLETHDAAIYYGTPDTSTAHQAVVFLFLHGGGCTGTLISPRWVLTAGHCVQGVSNIIVYFGHDEGSFTDYRTVVETHVSPQYYASSQKLHADIALIKLSSNAPSHIKPIPPLPASLALGNADLGKPLTFVGFGQTETGSFGTKLRADAVLRGLCGGSTYCDVSMPPPYSGYLMDIPWGSLYYYQSSGGPCSGDSGGPAFVFRNGVEYVAGVTSYGDEDCALYGVSTKVDHFESFIKTYVVIENCSNGIDDDNNGKTDCADDACKEHESCRIDECSKPTPIRCGDTVQGSSLYAGAFHNNYACSTAVSANNGERIYQFDVSEPTNALIRLRSVAPSNPELILLADSCDSRFCVDASTKPAGQDDIIILAAEKRSYFIVVDNQANPAAFSLSVLCTENCSNGLDDDGDGKIDCDDSECATVAPCAKEICGNGLDDDGDGLTDCDDPDCHDAVVCVPEDCGNNFDDNANGLFDCDDPACFTALQCQPEHCANGIDDNADGLVDCDDPLCAEAIECQPGAERCDNGIDDDGNGLSDCADPVCGEHISCRPSEICDNGVDDDGDGLVDCDDNDCACNEEPPATGKTRSSDCQLSPQSGASSTWPTLLLLLLAFLTLKRSRRARS